MKSTLCITNGDSAVGLLRTAGLDYEFLAWRDILHEGPVRGGLSLAEQSESRARYVAAVVDQPLQNIRREFNQRDAMLRGYRDFDRVELWFEHDLYDQLQILQILDWFSRRKHRSAHVSMVCADQYLGETAPQDVSRLFRKMSRVSGHQLHLAQIAWRAFTGATPRAWRRLLEDDLDALPFLRASVMRLLDELPALSNGLSRTEAMTLEILAQAPHHPGKLFRRYCQAEPACFLGDDPYWRILDNLGAGPAPLLRNSSQQAIKPPFTPESLLRITQAGRDVLACRANYLALASIDRWLGGVRLTPGNTWCWDAESMTVTR